MDTRVAKGRKGKAAKTARRKQAPFTERLGAVRRALAKKGEGFAAWIRDRVPGVRSGLERFGKDAKRTGIRIEEELKDDVKAVRKRLAETGKAGSTRKPTVRKAAKKPVAARKTTARRKAAVQKAPASRTAAGKKAAQKRKTPRAA